MVSLRRRQISNGVATTTTATPDEKSLLSTVALEPTTLAANKKPVRKRSKKEAVETVQATRTSTRHVKKTEVESEVEVESGTEASAFEDDEEDFGGCCSSEDDFEEDQPAKKKKRAATSKDAKKKSAKTESKKKPLVRLEDREQQEPMARLLPLTGGRLPIPWKGRLGYACINTFLRANIPPIYSGRTCRLSSIIEHRHPLRDPTQPEHPTKNRPDRTKPSSIERGLAYVQALGVANARDLIPIIRWNDRFGIKFMRLSSDLFPFASHREHGYPLAPFAADVLAELGRTVAELGHRVTTHPGQYTQLGSPRKEVVDAAMRDLAYHDEMLRLLKLPEQMDRDAVMIIHLGGTFGDKATTLARFRENYAQLPASIKQRLVLENDDVSWSVHDLLPLCDELDIPLVLDFHHHSIIFDQEALDREGTSDVTNLYDRIKAVWDRKGIRQKMHYSESRAGAVTARDRRAHSARVRDLPPCPDDMDLMIEAKDKEQAVFDLMLKYKLDGWEKIKSVVPGDRSDENAVYWPEGHEEVLKLTKSRVRKVDSIKAEVDDLVIKVDGEKKVTRTRKKAQVKVEETVSKRSTRKRKAVKKEDTESE
ncbi:hypothetical protein TD95_001270 [Thielaviopsis punctulata]|uniref:UV-damage endonuclease n=1 Tax=Thielaviopsis punctulata TaxID=72032 RepID=A0A0F4ZD18_9PEZI|nr:hypothetical protein TD95_001270 [Thielaviopsis punctulata]